MRSLFPAVRPSGTIIPFVKFLRSVNSDIFQGFFTTTKTQFLYLTLTLTLAPEKLEIWNWNCCVVCMICDIDIARLIENILMSRNRKMEIRDWKW